MLPKILIVASWVPQYLRSRIPRAATMTICGDAGKDLNAARVGDLSSCCHLRQRAGGRIVHLYFRN
jgi:hypothetical protein